MKGGGGKMVCTKYFLQIVTNEKEKKKKVAKYKKQHVKQVFTLKLLLL